MDKGIVIKKLLSEDLNPALELSLKVFWECSSSDYDDEGLKIFKKFIDDKESISMLTMYGAMDSKELIGIIATKEGGSHISLFFIEKSYQGLGIGRKLFEFAKDDNKPSCITVSSSTYAVEIYRRFGFVEIDAIQLKNGLKSVPMKYENIPY